MTRNTFLEELMNQLGSLPAEDAGRIREYYEELICDGLEQGRMEEDIVNGFGPVEKISQRIREDYGQLVRYEQRKPEREAQENREKQGEPEYNSNVAVHTIRVQAECISIVARPSNSDQARVLFQPRQGIDKVECYEEDGVFTFRHSMNTWFSWGIRGTHSSEPIIVEIPENFDGSLFLKDSNSSIRLGGFEHLKSACVETSNSRIEAIKLNCGELTLKTTNSRVEASNIAGRTLNISTTNGRLELENLSGESLEAVTNNGRVNARNCRMTEKIRLKSTNGKIDVDMIDAKNIELHTSNHTVNGTICGQMQDYAITSQTSNGKNNLPNYGTPAQAKTLWVKTTNGKIDVNFDK